MHLAEAGTKLCQEMKRAKWLPPYNVIIFAVCAVVDCVSQEELLRQVVKVACAVRVISETLFVQEINDLHKSADESMRFVL